MAKGLKLKVRKFLGPNPIFVEVTEEKTSWAGGGGGKYLIPNALHGECTFNSLLTNVFII